jgi:hypothetical protein
VWSARNTQPGLVRRSRTEAALRVSTLRDGYCKLASVARRGMVMVGECQVAKLQSD